jgi:hypothetical protein
MKETSYRKWIESYCAANGIAVPVGFGRNSPSRHAVVRRDSGTPKLVAKTWITRTDLAYYVEKTLMPELGADYHLAVDILDFKEGCKLSYSGSGRFREADAFLGTGEADS